MKPKNESIEEFLARGGEISVLPSVEIVSHGGSRFGRYENYTYRKPKKFRGHQLSYDKALGAFVVKELQFGQRPVVFTGTKSQCLDYINNQPKKL